MEFLRFGSSIPGSYWGCCACCIIQDFQQRPDDKASIQLVFGDVGTPITNSSGESLFAGPTYRDIFWQRLRYGTHGNRDMPDHTFLAIMTQDQIQSNTGAEWLALLKEAGFEFIRTMDNSVYTGTATIDGSRPEPDETDDEDYYDDEECCSSHPNYLFALFRNVGSGAIDDPFTPPPEWTDLEQVVPETWQRYSNSEMTTFAKEVQDKQLELYNNLPKGQFLTETQLTKDGVPVTLAGLRSENPQELKSHRDARKPKAPAKPAPFAKDVAKKAVAKKAAV